MGAVETSKQRRERVSLWLVAIGLVLTVAQTAGTILASAPSSPAPSAVTVTVTVTVVVRHYPYSSWA
jgi:uncharacterized lipoprotein YajG